jgi:SAM-dependent methyltransferase
MINDQNIDDSGKKISQIFAPNLLNPYYFIRSGLLKGIREFSSDLKGVLLDFGCGSKPYRSLFQVEGYIGLDYENPGHPHDNEHIDVFYDGKRIPFENDYFDAVLCTEVVEHVFNIEVVLKELNRVVKPGGKLLVTCPFVWNEHEVPHDFARYSKFGLTHLFENNGFELIRFKKSGHFISTIHQLMNLYFYELSKGKWYKIMPLRIAYKLFIYGGINLSGLFWSAVLPKNNTLYLNNIALFVKK